MKRLGLYKCSVILFFALLPLTAIVTEVLLVKSSLSLTEIIFKWAVFSGVGLRLGSAGVKQVLQPEFTAKKIFDICDEKALPIVREIGFANISLSSIALASLFFPTFRIPAAISGGLYFGLAGLLHILKVKASSEEKFAMLSDIYIFLVLVILITTNCR